MDLNFFDKNGKPIAYTEDGEHIYLFSGTPVAYIYEDAIYSFSGVQLGWFEDGWVRDLQGQCVFFTEKASGNGPFKPFKKFLPFKGFKKFLPFKGFRQFKKFKPFNHNTWSQLSGSLFFKVKN